MNGHQMMQLMEEFAPKRYAMEGDPIGLQVGNPDRPVKRVMIALDVLENVVDEAIANNVDLIIAHHPMMYRPLKKLALNEPACRMIEKLIKHDITVFAAHTNLDVAHGGVNDMLANALQLQHTRVLAPTFEQSLKKLAVFVPEKDADQVLQALGDAGAGSIGEYSHCSFVSAGTGRFLPGEQSRPHIGERGKLEQVAEVKIETVFPAHLEKKVLSAMLNVHPYEEPAYDVYSMDVKGEELGLGRIGELSEEMTLEQFANHAKGVLGASGVRVVGELDAIVKKVAVLGGDGNKYITHAKRQGADVFVTGDMYYHTAHDAMAMGLNIVDPGHHIEKIMKTGLAEQLKSMCDQRNYEVEIFPSTAKTDPFVFK